MAERIIAADGLSDKGLEGSDGDFLREGLQGFVQRLIEAEVAEVIGAGRYERTVDRQTYRNGSRERKWQTRLPMGPNGQASGRPPSSTTPQNPYPGHTSLKNGSLSTALTAGYTAACTGMFRRPPRCVSLRGRKYWKHTSGQPKSGLHITGSKVRVLQEAPTRYPLLLE